jgi:GNAT superfamily N-acetyltransferase
MAIEIKVLHRGDDNILMNVAAEVFDKPIDRELTREFLEDPRHHIAVAIDDGLVVGFASGVHYIHPDKPPELWINEVAVAPTHRRRGLLNGAAPQTKNLKCAEVFVSQIHLLWHVPIFWWHAWGAVVRFLAEGLGILGLLWRSVLLAFDTPNTD